MNEQLSATQLNERRAHYFMEQQIGIHGTIVSVALGVAGLAAAGLLVVSAADRPYHILFWMLWLTSLLGVGTVYSGMTVNVYVLPSKIPNVGDMFLPFAIGLMEFLLFAVLTSPLTNQISPRSVVAVWFGCFGLFGFSTSMVIRRVRQIFRNSAYEVGLSGAIDDVVRQMRADLAGAATCSVIGIAGAVSLGSSHGVSVSTAYVIVPIIMVLLTFGLINQHRQGSTLESLLRTFSSSVDDRGQEYVSPSRSRDKSGNALI